MKSENTTDAEHWKAKFEECEKNLSALKPLAADGVKAYDELLNKYNVNQSQYKRLEEKLQEKERQLNEMKDLLEPVYDEYDELQTKLSIEAKCREEVENYASKLTKEYKVLHRQSQAYLNTTGALQLAPALEKEPDMFKEHSERMNVRIKEMEQEITELNRKVRVSGEEATTQKEKADKAMLRMQKASRELEQCKKSLKQYEQALEELAGCSEGAYKDYQSLKKKYNIEIECRNKAEQYASQMYVQTEAMKRQSAILLTSVASDERLVKALNAVEEANKELEGLKQKHSDEVKSLEDKLTESKEMDRVTSLEEELARLEKENEELQKKNEDFNSQYSELSQKYKELETKYAVLSQPPPPPPPPLPVDFNKTKKNVTDIIRENREAREQKLKTIGVQQTPSYAKAIDEMMNRIKGGKPVLKSTNNNLRRPSAPDATDAAVTGQAMEELHKIFTTMKRTRSEGDLHSYTVTFPEDNDQRSDLAKTFQKIRGDTKGSSNSAPPRAALSRVQEERDSQVTPM